MKYNIEGMLLSLVWAVVVVAMAVLYTTHVIVMIVGTTNGKMFVWLHGVYKRLNTMINARRET